MYAAIIDWIVNIVPVYKQASHLLPASRHSCAHIDFVSNLTHMSFQLFVLNQENCC